ncbi:MAG: PKD domain-containing protein, partial [Planctomycetota bacterium]
MKKPIWSWTTTFRKLGYEVKRRPHRSKQLERNRMRFETLEARTSATFIVGAELTAGDALNELLRSNDLDQPLGSPGEDVSEKSEAGISLREPWLSEGIASSQPVRFDSPMSVATSNDSFLIRPEDPGSIGKRYAPIVVGSFDTGLSLLSSDPQLPAAAEYSDNVSASVLEDKVPSGLDIGGGDPTATGAISPKSKSGAVDSGTSMNIRLSSGADGGGGGGGNNLQAESSAEGESTGDGGGDTETSSNPTSTTDVEVAYLMDASLDGWEVRESGGSSGAKGGVTVEGGEVVLREGDSALVDLRYSLTIPENPGTLSFEYTSLAFDPTATDSVRDAFEFALLDENGDSLTPVFDTAGRDSAFNVTEGLGAAFGTNASHEVFGDAGQVNLDISGLTAGTDALLVFRLVNGDTDVETTIRLRRGDPVLAVAADGPATANQFSPVQFSGSFTHPGRPDPSYQYEWTVLTPDGQTLLRETETLGESGVEPLDFTPEVVGDYQVSLRIIGSEGSTGTETLSLDVIEPQPVLAEANLSVPEDSPLGTIVGSVSSGTDTTGITFGITDGDLSSAFAIDDQGVITVADPALLDAEARDSGTVTITATLVVDPSRTWTGIANVEITNVNEPPGDFSLSSDSVPENAPAGTLVGTISAFDPEDPDTSLSFQLIDSEGNPGHPLFEIVGNELRTRAPLDFEDDASYPLTIRATHPNGESGEATLEVQVADINEAPVVIYNGPEGDILDSDPSLWDISWTIIDPEGTVAPNGIANARSILTLDGAVIASSGETSLSVDLLPHGLGDYVLTVDAEDRTGLSSQTTFSFTIWDDDIDGPAITVLGANDQLDSEDNVLRYAIEDVDSGIASRSIQVIRESDSEVVLTDESGVDVGEIDLNGLAADIYRIEFQSTDTDADRPIDEVTTLLSHSFEIIDDDSEGPAIVLGGSAGEENHGDDQFFSWSFSDPSGVSAATIEVFREGNSNPIYSSASTNASAFNFDSFGLGVFTLVVTATDNDSDTPLDNASSSATRSVSVINLPPVAAFTHNAETPAEGFPVQFDGGASTDPDGDRNLFTYHWDFGDGTSGAGQTPVHAYANDGTYAVTLTVTDSFGATDSVTRQVTIDDTPPSPTIGLPAFATGGEGESIFGARVVASSGNVALSGATLQALSPLWKSGKSSLPLESQPEGESTPLFQINEGTTLQIPGAFDDPAGAEDGPFNYVWSLVSSNGGIVTESTGTRPTPGVVTPFDFTVPDNGIYTIRLTVTDIRNVEAVTEIAFEALNLPPSYDIQGPAEIDGQTLTLPPIVVSDPGFTDPSGGTEETIRAWIDWGDGSPVEEVQVVYDVRDPSETGPTTGRIVGTHTYATPEIPPYRIHLVTDDDGGVGFDADPDPVANVALATDTSEEGALFTASGFITDEGPQLIPYQFQWEAIAPDGAVVSQQQGSVSPAGPVPDFVFAFPNDGLYTIRLTINDITGYHESIDEATVDVADVPASFDISAPATSPEGSAIEATVTITDPAGAADGPFSYQWELISPSGGVSVSEQGTITEPGPIDSSGLVLPDNGDYTLRLTVQDAAGNSVTRETTIVGENEAPSYDVLDNPTYDGLTVTLPPIRFWDPGFSDPAGGTQETIQAWIDWGDGTDPTEAIIVYDERQPGDTGPTTGYIIGSYTYASEDHELFQVHLVTDDDGGVGYDADPDPEVEIVMPSDSGLKEGDLFTIHGNITDEVLQLVDYEYVWELIDFDGNVLIEESGTQSTAGAVPGFAIPVPDDGTYLTRLTITDNTPHHIAVDEASFYARDVSPSVTSISPSTGQEGDLLQSTGQFTDPAGVNDGPYTFHWELISPAGLVSSQAIGVLEEPGAVDAFDYTVADNGEYTVRLTVTDADGIESVNENQFTIGNLPPCWEIHGEWGIDGYTVTLPLITFEDPGFTDSLGGTQEIIYAELDWDDGTVEFVEVIITNPGGPGQPTTGIIAGQHTYQEGGNYVLFLDVFDDDDGRGCGGGGPIGEPNDGFGGGGFGFGGAGGFGAGIISLGGGGGGGGGRGGQIDPEEPCDPTDPECKPEPCDPEVDPDCECDPEVDPECQTDPDDPNVDPEDPDAEVPNNP